ncbi:glycine cleavage system H protein, mitochondrial-like [Aricia agestis]|uniref:glycine cleavage system H protein, mitochondrial-like n=1 Tax=Aricia agestis TaxID=91739 RepID=UPI001C208045|nr:glycine cleavage system H protein, mitochondrial-like [Aricia agestis]XP_041986571.1 glycine cleavage system H protein, mitochondrial-like [Aricia agestis]
MVLCSVIRVASRMTRSTMSHCCRRALYSSDAKSRYYTKKHEWVSVDSGVGTVGISSYAQDALGEVVFAQLPDVGKTVAAGDECGALESVKAASEVYTPVSGSITEKNDAVESTPSIINKSCYEEGWLFKVKLSSPEELQKLMNQEAYDKYLEEAEH